MTDIYTICGWVGAIILIVAFFLLNFKYLQMGLTYEILNIIGSLGIGIAAFRTGNIPTVTLQVFWAGIAFVMIFRGFPKIAKHRYHRHEERLSHD